MYAKFYIAPFCNNRLFLGRMNQLNYENEAGPAGRVRVCD
jgi:hypothetical protein